MKKIVAVFGFVCVAVGLVYAQGSASCNPAPSGLVGWWKGDGNGNDNVGSDNALVPTGVAYTPGEVALGFNLNGNYDDTNRILVPDAPQLNFGPNKDFSVEAWIQPLSNPGNYTDLSGEVMTVIGKRYAPSFYTAWGYEMYLGNGRLCFQLIDSLNRGGNFYNLAAEPDLRDGEFHHVAVTVQRNSTTGLRFYVDGQLIATFDPTAVQGDLSSTSPLRIGNHPTPGVKAFYHGVIDEVSLYNRALSSNEIAAIYNAGGAGKCPVPPTILVQPTSQTVTVGGTATFRVSAYGTPPLFYQWSFNGTYIPGATNTSLTLTNVQPAQAGRYAVWVAISYGSIISSNAVLTVLGGAPSCYPAPSGLVAWWQAEGNANDSIGANNGVLRGGVGFASGKVGQAFLFNNTNADVRIPASSSLNVGAGGGLTIEGWINPTSISTQPVLIAEWNNGSWWGSHFAMTSYSGVGTLYANLADTSGNWHQIWTSSGVVTSNTFQHVGLTYDKASGVATLYLNGLVVAQQSLGSFTPQTSYDLYLGRRIAGDFIGGCFAGLMDELSLYNRALSAGEIAAIYNASSAGKCPPSPAPPVIVSQPTNQTVSVGGTATFRVVASGSPPLNYQWKRNGTNILGATNFTLTLANVQPANAGGYSVVVANVYGSTNSANAVLTVKTPSSCDPAPAGLVAWWQGEGNANDSAGINDGISTNGVTYATGTVGRAFGFNGVNQYVYVPRSTSLNSFSNQLTIEFWMYANPSNLMNTYQGLVTSDYYGVEISDGYGGNVGINWYINTTTGEHLISTVNGGGIPVSRGQWHHIAGTYDGAKLQLYIDGLPSGNAQTASGTILPMLTTSFVAIGSDDGRTYCNCTGRYFWGLIDEVSIYSRGLSSNEITAIYNAGSAGKCPLSLGSPVITSQPTNQMVTVGGTATFRVTASGTPPLFYQWRFNGTNILGATNTTLTLNNVQPTQAGTYAVQVANAGGSTNSVNAVLTVLGATSCDPAPLGLVSWWRAEGNASDSAGTNNGTLIGGVTYTNGEVGRAFSLDGTSGSVFVPASSSLNVGLSSGFTIEGWINPATTATLQPVMEWNTGGNSGVHFWISADNYGGLKVGSLYANVVDTSGGYHSFSSGSGIIVSNQFQHVALTYDKTSGAGRLYLNGLVVTQQNLGIFTPRTSYSLYLGNRPGTAYFWSGLLDEISVYSRPLSSNEIAAIYSAGSAGKCPMLLTAPVIITQPTNQTVVVGGTATFRVTAGGTPPLFYQWRFNGTNILGATNTTLTLNNVQLTQAGNYSVQVANTGGSTNSANAVLTVITPPSSVPVITRFSPASGMAGTSVRISGTNFSPVAASNTVYFGAVRAVVSAASATNLMVNVPVGTTYAPIAETVNGLTAYANAPFLPTFPGSGILTNSSLGPQIILPTGGSPGKTVIADFDGDGKPDLAVNCGSDHTIYIYRNISTNNMLTAGSFGSPVVLHLGTGCENGFVTADVDGDGKLDLVFLDEFSGQVVVCRNLCIPGSITTNSFGHRVNFAVGSDPRGVAVQDLDGDGKPEIVVANWGDSTISVLRNIGTAGSVSNNSFAPAINFATGSGPQNVLIADLDGDSKADVVTVNLNATASVISVLRNTSSLGSISLAARLDLPGLLNGLCVAAGDLDGDGKLDLVVGSFAGGQAVSVYRNASTPGSIITNSFAIRVDFGVGGWGTGLALGDVDGDGKPDVAVTTKLPSHLSLFKNASLPGTFTNNSLAHRLDFTSGSGAYGVAIGDLDGDGRADVVFVNNDDNTLSVCQNITPPGVSSSCDPAPSGLVAWWRAEGNASDSAGTNNGTLIGGVTYTNGEVGRAFSLDGTSGSVLVPASSSLNVGLSSGFTIEGWINPATTAALQPVVEWNTGGNSGVHFWISADNYGGLKVGSLYANVVDTSGGYHSVSSGSGIIVSNQFQHVALTYDKTSGVGRLYLNGLVVTQQNLGIFTPRTSYNLYLGNRPGTAYFWSGLLDEISVYSRPLSSNEIAAIYSAGSAGKCPLPTNYVNGTPVSPQPTLASVKTGANMQLTWPISAGTFHVQSADTPIGPWTDAACTVTTNGESAIVTVTATNQQQYFRLVGP